MRKYAYTIIGKPPRDHRLLVCGTRYSCSFNSCYGIHDVQLVEGSVNGDKFEEFITNSVVPYLQPLQHQLYSSMDNATIHHVPTAILQTGALLLFLPPYSPDLNPVELIFSKVIVSDI